MKIADEVEVDVSRQKSHVHHADAIATAEAITIEGVRVPFLSLEMLINSKTTSREQDRADLVAAARPAGTETPARRRGELKRIISLSLVPVPRPKDRAVLPLLRDIAASRKKLRIRR